MGKYIYNRAGDRVGYIDDNKNRYDSCGNFVSSEDSQGYRYNNRGERTSWYDRNSGYTCNNRGERTSYTDKNGCSWGNDGHYRGRTSRY